MPPPPKSAGGVPPPPPTAPPVHTVLPPAAHWQQQQSSSSSQLPYLGAKHEAPTPGTPPATVSPEEAARRVVDEVRRIQAVPARQHARVLEMPSSQIPGEDYSSKYRRLVKLLHPDKRSVDGQERAGGREVCDAVFNRVQEAHAYFKDLDAKRCQAQARGHAQSFGQVRTSQATQSSTPPGYPGSARAPAGPPPAGYQAAAPPVAGPPPMAPGARAAPSSVPPPPARPRGEGAIWDFKALPMPATHFNFREIVEVD